MSMKSTNWPLHVSLVLASLYVYFFGCFSVRLAVGWMRKRRQDRLLPRAIARSSKR